jgi:hypothetical protein
MVVTTEYDSGPSGRSSPANTSRLDLGGAGTLVLGEEALFIETGSSSNGNATTSSPEKSSFIYKCFQACIPTASKP